MKKIGHKLCVLAVIASMSVLAACGSTDTVKNAKGDVKTVTIWSGNSHSKVAFEKLVNEFNTKEGKEKGIFIDYQVKDGGTITQSVEIAIKSGDAPDMFTSGSTVKLAENDNIVAIDDIKGGKEFIKKYKGKLYRNVNTYKDKTYTVPCSATTQGLLYNKDLFKEAGLVDKNGNPTPPETFDEMVEYAKILTNKEKRQYGIILPTKWSGWFGSDILSQQMSSCGYEGYNPVNDSFDYSGLVPIMNAFLKMKEDGSTFPGEESLDNDTARAQFSAGNIGMKFGFSFDVGVLNDQFPSKCDWGVAPYPVVNADNKYMQRMDYGSSFYINKKALETHGDEVIMEVLKFFTGDKFISALYKMGVELPYDWEIVKDVTVVGDRKGWEDFAKLIAISTRYPQSPRVDMGANVGISERFINEVWSGKSTPEQLCEYYTNVRNEAREKYYSVHTDENTSDYANPDWNIHR